MSKSTAPHGAEEPSFEDFQRDWLTMDDIAPLLGLTTNAIQARVCRKAGNLPTIFRRGYYIFFRRCDVEAFLAARGEKSYGK